ncbi:histidine--tRNA ligase [Paracraurococcus ruber]|uniref:Histidine--tRNA ligase n=1 Tax=Paracraurococcus ruber TaxID=77675 RepID=A0ABS1D3W9_9PROT|nr:histidine--tRNA ligase [Paracraurococcus ruber]MBK1661454.1 histidine--tRNA ligase [Paracraurococcus ruber]TDG27867.1 histidine--tRNA ligase [Paracraurococcus ruber]
MAQAPLQPARGTHDLIGAEFRRHHHVIETARRIATLYGFEEWATPIFEDTRVFSRGLGDTSDVVSKEMYSFEDRGGESVTLRPENTAGVCRALVSNGLTQANLPRKVFYAGPMFRYERPQKGRYRQFHQIGIEVLGAAEPLADAEVIACGWHIQQELGIEEGTVLEINTLGDGPSRDAYRAALVAYFTRHRDALSAESQARLEKNPLRIVDSKDPKDRALVAGAPTILEHLTEEAAGFYAAVKRHLAAFGVPFRENPRIVRGLDYYSHTAFEFVTDRLGAQGTVMGGGRYNGLVEEMGGPPTPSVGWAAGVERLSLLLEAGDLTPPAPRPVAIIPVGEAAEAPAINVLQSLREHGVVAEIAYKGNTKRRMERANKVSAGAAVILGDDELADGMAVVKNLEDGSQHRVPLTDLLRALAETGVVESAAQAMLNLVLEEEFGAGDEDAEDGEQR